MAVSFLVSLVTRFQRLWRTFAPCVLVKRELAPVESHCTTRDPRFIESVSLQLQVCAQYANVELTMSSICYYFTVPNFMIQGGELCGVAPSALFGFRCTRKCMLAHPIVFT
jgi:hypothetical protein